MAEDKINQQRPTPNPDLKDLERLVGTWKGSDNRFKGTLSRDGNSLSGAWEWPGGGYEVTGTRVA